MIAPERIFYQQIVIFAFLINFTSFICIDGVAFVHFVEHKKDLSNFSYSEYKLKLNRILRN